MQSPNSWPSGTTGDFCTTRSEGKLTLKETIHDLSKQRVDPCQSIDSIAPGIYRSIDGENHETHVCNRNFSSRACHCRLGPALTPEFCPRPLAKFPDPRRRDRL